MAFARCFPRCRRSWTTRSSLRWTHTERNWSFAEGCWSAPPWGRETRGQGTCCARPPSEGTWIRRLWGPKAPSYRFSVSPRDEAGHSALADITNRGINRVANAVARSNDHILDFLRTLRTELAFYLAGVQLHGKLVGRGLPVCFPTPAPAWERRHEGAGLYDVSLALLEQGPVVGNDVAAVDRWVLVITGANRGGKTTFLRSVGQAQLMMQAGMFMGAESFHANVSQGVFTHFTREETRNMKEGKLDEELRRMSEIADALCANSLFILNESFSSKNEPEGSEISRQVISALAEKKVKVFFVTHLYDFARRWYEAQREDTLFLRAERRPDGTRTFRMVPGPPLATSFGEDVYRRVLGPLAG